MEQATHCDQEGQKHSAPVGLPLGAVWSARADLGEDGEVLDLAVSREEDGYVDDLCGLGVVAEE